MHLQSNRTQLALRLGSQQFQDTGDFSSTLPQSITVQSQPLSANFTSIDCTSLLQIENDTALPTAGRNYTCDVVTRDQFGNWASLIGFESKINMNHSSLLLVFLEIQKLACLSTSTGTACAVGASEFLRITYRSEKSMVASIPMPFFVSGEPVPATQIVPLRLRVRPDVVNPNMTMFSCLLWGLPAGYPVVNVSDCPAVNGTVEGSRCLIPMELNTTRSAATANVAKNAVWNSACSGQGECVNDTIEVPNPNGTVIANNLAIRCVASLRDVFGNPTGAWDGSDPSQFASSLNAHIETDKSPAIARFISNSSLFNVSNLEQLSRFVAPQDQVDARQIWFQGPTAAPFKLTIAGNFSVNLTSFSIPGFLRVSPWGWVEPAAPVYGRWMLNCDPRLLNDSDSYLTTCSASARDAWGNRALTAAHAAKWAINVTLSLIKLTSCGQAVPVIVPPSNFSFVQDGSYRAIELIFQLPDRGYATAVLQVENMLNASVSVQISTESTCALGSEPDRNDAARCACSAGNLLSVVTSLYVVVLTRHAILQGTSKRRSLVVRRVRLARIARKTPTARLAPNAQISRLLGQSTAPARTSVFADLIITT